MNLRGCEQCESSKGPGAAVFEPRGCQGLGKPCSQGEEPRLGADTLHKLRAKFRPGIVSEPLASGGSPPSSLPAGCPAHVLLSLVMDIPRGQQAGQGHQADTVPEAVLSPPATRDQSTGTPAASLRALFNHSLANRLYSLPFSVCLLYWLDWREGCHGTSSFIWEGHRWQHMAPLVAPPG